MIREQTQPGEAGTIGGGSLKRLLAAALVSLLLGLAALVALAPAADARTNDGGLNALLCAGGGGLYVPGPFGHWGCAYPDWWIVCDADWNCTKGGNAP